MKAAATQVTVKGRRGRKAKNAGGEPADTAVLRANRGVRQLLRTYEIKPGDRLNEVVLGQRFELSRTPLREALHGLVAERLLRFEPSLGFHRPQINLQEIVSLYELRIVLETSGTRFAIDRAGDEEIEALIEYWQDAIARAPDRSSEEQIAADEIFHERLAGLGRNEELVASLRNINSRIHFIRWALTSDQISHDESDQKHLEMVKSLLQRDKELSVRLLSDIIAMRQEEITEVLKEGAARLYIV